MIVGMAPSLFPCLSLPMLLLNAALAARLTSVEPSQKNSDIGRRQHGSGLACIELSNNLLRMF